MQNNSNNKVQSPTLRSETIDLLKNRVSIRSFTDEKVSEVQIETILRAAFRAPTSSNIQSYSVVVVREKTTLRKLYKITGNQDHIVKAPIFLAFCADLTRINAAMKTKGHNIDNNNLEIGLVSSIDAALVGMSAYLAAESIGLKGVMIGAVRNDAVATAKVLRLPKKVYCVFGMCLGVANQIPPQKPRIDYSAMVHYDQYGSIRDDRDLSSILLNYDNSLSTHYRSVNRVTPDNAWTHDINKKFHPQLRDELRAQLIKLGFDFR